jgi:ketosteroid isomerase-like protein
MDNVAIVKEILSRLCENLQDQEVLRNYFAPQFEHIANGVRSDLSGYGAHLANFAKRYPRVRIPAWDEAFAAEDKVVLAYTLEATKSDGSTDRIPVMMIWRLKDGKVVALREVDAWP